MPAEATADTPAAEPPKKAQREESYISERIREGVERGTAELRAEIARLQQEFRAKTPAAEPAKAYDGTDPSDPKPSPDRFETHDEYLDARDAWNERRIERKQAKAADGAKVTQEREELTAAQQARVKKFAEQLKSASAADPEFASKLSPEVRSLRPIEAVQPGESAGPEHIVGGLVFDSPIAPKVLLHFSEKPEQLARLIAIPPEIQAMPHAVRVARHIEWIVKEFGKVEAAIVASETPAPGPPKTPPASLTTAPAPAQTLGTKPASPVDPKAAAVRSGDTRAFRAIRRQERLAAMPGRR